DRLLPVLGLDAQIGGNYFQLLDLCSSNSEIFGGGSTPAGRSYFGSASPGPHQSRCELLSFHRSQTLWERSVSSSSLGKPMTRANRSAPSPTSITWPVCSMTALASSDGFFVQRTPATDPARLVGPCMQQESSSTTPSSFGRPPR